jgi:sugar lactone lactonase YvrE
LHPPRAVEGGRVTLDVVDLAWEGDRLPRVTIGPATVSSVFSSPHEVKFVVPQGLGGGRTDVRLSDLAADSVPMEVGRQIATGLHQVDSPAIDREGNVYLTYSGSRGLQTAVSIYKVRPDGIREAFVTGITNPTSLAFDHDGRLHVSSRFDGTVLRIDSQGGSQVVASDLGVACGIAFDQDGAMYIGDRSGTIFRMGVSGGMAAFASLPPSVAAFHLAYSAADGMLYATAPTLATRDPVYRIDRHGHIDIVYDGFGRPQGLAVDPKGDLFVADALANRSGIYRLRRGKAPELVVSGPSLIGLAFDPRGRGSMVVTSSDSAYRFD